MNLIPKVIYLKVSRPDKTNWGHGILFGNSDRFSDRSRSYYRLVTPIKSMNDSSIYSFSIQPESYQPDGGFIKVDRMEEPITLTFTTPAF